MPTRDLSDAITSLQKALGSLNASGEQLFSSARCASGLDSLYCRFSSYALILIGFSDCFCVD